MPVCDLPDMVREHVTRTGMFGQPGVALVAVSGGPDSVALLDVMVALAPECALSLVVAHVDHGILPESARVARGVVELARCYGVPVQVVRLNLGPKTSETVARRERYRALRAVQRDQRAAYLVTAHHAGDQAETVLYRVLRGSGVAGLAGIPARGPAGLVRPLLPFTKAQLTEWLGARVDTKQGLPPVHHDPANADRRHDRSWMRVDLFPSLRERFGEALDQRLCDTAREAADNRVAWSQVLRALPELAFERFASEVEVARAPFRRYDKLLCGALLRALARELDCPVGAKRAARLLHFVRFGSSGRVMQLGAGVEAELIFDRLRLARARRRLLPADCEATKWGVQESGGTRWGRWQFSWRPEPAGVPERHAMTTWTTVGGGQIRALCCGDRIFPLGGVGRRRVRRVLMEARVPARDRAVYPLVTLHDEVLWIPGICRSARDVPRPGQPALRLEARADGQPRRDDP